MVEISDYPERFVTNGDAEALRQKARERIRERLLIVERMCDGPWFLPSGFSIVDIYAAMFTRWRGSIGKEWLAEGHIPKLDASRARAVAERPAIAPVWKRHFGRPLALVRCMLALRRNGGAHGYDQTGRDRRRGRVAAGGPWLSRLGPRRVRRPAKAPAFDPWQDWRGTCRRRTEAAAARRDPRRQSARHAALAVRSRRRIHHGASRPRAQSGQLRSLPARDASGCRLRDRESGACGRACIGYSHERHRQWRKADAVARERCR